MAARWLVPVLLLILMSLSDARGQEEEEVQALVVDQADNSANPRIWYLGYNDITFSPNPPVIGDVTSIHVRLGNSGKQPASGVEVTLSWAEFGLAFNGYELIGTQVAAELAAESELLLTFRHVFQSRARISLRAEITATDAGGNANTWDDVGMVNLNVLHVGGNNATFEVPLRNNGDAPLTLTEVSVFCSTYRALTEEDLPFPIEWGGTRSFVDDWQGETAFRITGTVHFVDDWQGETAYFKTRNKDVRLDWEECSFKTGLFASSGEELGSEITLAPGEEQIVSVVADGFNAGGAAWVGLGAYDAATNAWTHAMTLLKPATPAEIFNSPLLCCISSVRLRVLLGRKLAVALITYEAGDIAGALSILRFVASDAEQLNCLVPNKDRDCLERLLLMVTQLGRLLAKEVPAGIPPPETVPVDTSGRRKESKTAGTTEEGERRSLLEFQIPEKVVMEKDADFYGRAGLPGAALAQYQRAVLRFGTKEEEYSMGAGSGGFFANGRQTHAQISSPFLKSVLLGDAGSSGTRDEVFALGGDDDDWGVDDLGINTTPKKISGKG